MPKQHQKKFNKTKKPSFSRFAITAVTIFSLVIYQSFAPLAIARAAGGEQVIKKTEQKATEEITEVEKTADEDKKELLLEGEEAEAEKNAEIEEKIKKEKELLKDEIEKTKKAEEKKMTEEAKEKAKEKVEKEAAEELLEESEEREKKAEGIKENKAGESGEEKAEEDKEEAEDIEKDEAGENEGEVKDEETKDEENDVEDGVKEIPANDEDLESNILSSEEQVADNEEVIEEVENNNKAVVENNSEVNADTGNNKIGDGEESADEADEAESAEGIGGGEEAGESLADTKEEVETEEKTGDLEIGTEETDSEELDEKVNASIDASTSEGGAAEENGIEFAEEDNENIPETEEEILEEEEDDIIIETGMAEGIVNIFNDINSNITGENWEEAIYNLYGDYIGDINLLEQFLELLKKAKEDSENKSVSVDNKNEADVKNNVEVNVNTGNNEINNESGETGDASITTGDANAEVNIVNFINQNITGNNWLFSVINVFGNWFGDLIVPGEDLLEIDSPSDYSKVEITNENEADIKNNVNINVNTGENEINGGGNNASIETGNAVSGVEVVNIVNRNTTGNNWFFLMVNNMGSWVGNILNWNEEAGAYNNVFSYDFGTAGGEEYMNGGMLNVHSQNTASLENNVNINVNTGGNIINGEGNANIKTGNAGAWANIFNFVNNNITGNNWLFGIINVMGSWTGDVVFAYPDLEISISDGKESVNAGEAVNYTVAYKNTGEAKAESVEVMVSLPEQVSYKSDTSGSAPAVSGNDYAWALPGLEAGEENSFIISAVVSEQIADETILESGAGIKTGTAEKELENNYSSDQTTALAPETSNIFSLNNVNISSSVSTSSNSPDPDIQTENFNSNGQEQEINPQLEISRESNISAPIQAGYAAQHEIILENTGDSPIYGIEVEDEIENEKGETVVKYIWKAGGLLAGEKVLVEYEILINGQTNPGVYEYKASACGYDIKEEKVESGKAFSEMSIVASAGTYYEHLPENADGGIIPIAQAAGISGTGGNIIPGIESDHPVLPFWIWMLAALSYLLIINWSLFPKKKIIQRK